MPETAPEDRLELSVLIPVYNEEESLDELRAELFPILQDLGRTFEVVFVDDGSRDKSPEILRRFFEEDERIRVIRFVRNFGQQMATTAGLRHCHGRAVIIMDADLQSPPHHIPELLAKLDEGFDIVYGVREESTGPLYRRMGTVVANYLIGRLTGVYYPDVASGFLALKDDLVRSVNHFNQKSRYLSTLFAWLSYGRSASVAVSRRKRKYGHSHYRFWQLVRITVNLITNWSTRPLHFALWAGFAVTAAAGIVFLRWAYLLWSEGWRAGELTLYTLALMVVAATNLYALAIMSAYISRIYGEVRENPPYVIGDILERD
jgi:undecaprenyl-phosphate 4-deoxy-4-formamido-L-arabinose transferase